MAKKAPVRSGRPKVNPTKAFTRRHVVNISPEMEAAVNGFAEESGISRMTDALRALVTQALRARGAIP